ncbi:MAG TPA: hypothetical protein VHE81_18520 [Lacipirellulaceae bacterium]|nr:hypothetical protein [Lacipirellulaceae bacterium]
MVNFPSRNDRRRRVLKEEFLSISGARAAVRMNSRVDSADEAPRYSDAAGIENHPQITDFVPRRYGTIALLVAFGAVLTAFSSALHYFMLPVAAAHGINATTAIDLAAHANLSAWLAAVVWFVTGGFCLVTYSIRRHRIDDYRGRFRIWLSAALACLVLSANSVAGFHEFLADVLTHVTGWTALRYGAAWWLAIAGLPLIWIFARVLLDVRECRLAATLLVGAAACYALSTASLLGYGPAVVPYLDPILIAAPLLFGHWLVFIAVLCNARFVVLDAQGLITIGRRVKEKTAADASNAKPASIKSSPATSTSSTTATTVPARPTLQPARTPVDSDKWLDGRRPERNRYEDDDDPSTGDRKLSKAERKQLRKLKAQNRAA